MTPGAASLEARDSGTERLLVAVGGGVARITFNNPEKHNALTADMRAALPGVLARLGEDPGVRVIVLTGAGERAFVSGADISEFDGQRDTPEARSAYDRGWAAVAEAWAAVERPVLAMIRGYCIGGGLMTAMQADIRVAAEGSQFGIPAARLGLGYGYGGVRALVDLVGPAWAAEILFSARRLSAEEALRIGLVNRVVPAARLEEEVMDLAGSIAANAPLTVAACKAAIREAMRDPGRRDEARVSRMVEACFRSEDYVEGRRAFRERRPPSFSGR
ncbi:MAG TPA: enoyl-CoA hydratase [Candidatus Dormibacteraeota bacterium]|nr:enoyl-CoA hydratase [Candidatus Dormibacteraeota bacterium]